MKAGILAVGIAAAALLPGTAAGGPTTVVVTIHHSAFSPSHLAFPAGATVHFVIHNTDPIDHEFIVGGPALQYYMEHTAHPTHDGSVPGQISIPAGETLETTYTVPRLHPLLFGCHLPGHYAYGMRGVIVVM